MIGETSTTVAEVLDAVRRRDLGCEGIPMLLALHGAAPAAADDPRRAWGQALATRLAVIHSEVRRLEVDPRNRAERDARVAADNVAVEGLEDVKGEAPSGQVARCEVGDGVELEAARAVSQGERRLAEAVSVLAFCELSEPRVQLTTSDSGGGQSAGGPGDPGEPLARLQLALGEGRFVTVVNYHNTPASSAATVGDELARWGRAFAPVGVEEMARLFAGGTWPDPRPPMIPVFYEGYRNNVEVGAPACERAGLVGWFFLITGFLDAAPEAQASFAHRHHIALAEEELRAGARLAMTWSQAAALAPSHVVTAHTATHRAAHQAATSDALQAEVIAPGRAIARVTGEPAVAHAWLFGSDLTHDPRPAGELSRAGYRWLFSNTGIDDVAAWARGEVGARRGPVCN